MIAVCNGIKYKYISRSKEIITKCAEKTDSTFNKDKEIYYKTVDEVNLTDIYTAELMVFYDTRLKNVPIWWKIADMQGSNIKIRFASGVLPGWDIEEKNVCTSLIAIKDVPKAKIRYTYKKKDNINVESLVIEEKINTTDLMRTLDKCSENNL